MNRFPRMACFFAADRIRLGRPTDDDRAPGDAAAATDAGENLNRSSRVVDSGVNDGVRGRRTPRDPSPSNRFRGV